MSFSRDAYDVVLADLRAKRDEIETAIKAIEAVRPQTSAPSAVAAFGIGVPTPPPATRPFFGMSIEEAAKHVLKSRSEPMGPVDIVNAIKEGGLVMSSAEPANTVSSVLNRGWRNGSDLVRVSRGMWGLAEWYPDRDMRFVPSSKEDAEPEDGKAPQPAEDDPLLT